MQPSIGPLELLIIAAICVVGIIILVGAAALVTFFKRQPRAGAPLPGQNCPSCGKATVAGAPFCPHCGTRMTS